MSDDKMDLIIMLILTGIVVYGLWSLIVNGIQWTIHMLLTNKIVQGAAIFSIIYIMLRLFGEK